VAQQSVTILRGAEPVEANVRVYEPGRYGVKIDGVVREVAFGSEGRVEIDGRRIRAETLWRDGDILVMIDGRSLRFGTVDPLAVAAGAGPAGDAVTAPMPGVVRQVSVAVGDAVSAGKTVAVMEAMKMEQSLKAPRDGTVAEVLVTEGDQVGDGDVLVRLEEVDA
jgi:3-methylcrotonyl-CoA carboxylase alpha subunit